MLTGLETFTLAGQQFATPGAASGEGAPGLVVEFVGSFQRADLLNFLTQVSEELTGATNPAELDLAADRALLPLQGQDVNGFFEMAGLPPVLTELRNFVDAAPAARAGPAMRDQTERARKREALQLDDVRTELAAARRYAALSGPFEPVQALRAIGDDVASLGPTS